MYKAWTFRKRQLDRIISSNNIPYIDNLVILITEDITLNCLKYNIAIQFVSCHQTLIFSTAFTHPQGKKLWTVKLPASVLTLEVLDNKQKNYKAVMVALSNKEVHIYRDKYLADVIKCEDAVTGMKYGRFGREESCLIMTTQGMCCIYFFVKMATYKRCSV